MPPASCVAQGLRFVGMMQYDGDLKLPTNFLVPPPEIMHVSGQFLVSNGISTFACSETQKFGHVTFFWNGNRSGYLDAKLEQFLEVGCHCQYCAVAGLLGWITIRQAGDWDCSRESRLCNRAALTILVSSARCQLAMHLRRRAAATGYAYLHCVRAYGRRALDPGHS
jgi:hypothetical protein